MVNKNLDKIFSDIKQPQIKDNFEKWNLFLDNEVDFWLKTSEKHTKEHCSRVLLFCLLIADKQGLSQKETDILCMAAVFHDSRRQDDWYDVGHGQRAADYYGEYCTTHELAFEQVCYEIMYYHDRDDQAGIDAIAGRNLKEQNGVLLYQSFKDADALDRFRLGPDGLDIKYLRTNEARSLYSYAKMVWFQYFA